MEFKIHNKFIGDKRPLFFIAEAGVNHNGSIEMGKQLIDIAVKSGADAIKFQTFKTENIITPEAPKSTYHIETTGHDADQTWFELLKTQEMTEKMHIELIKYSNEKGIIFLSTPYDEESADLLEELDIPVFKIASTDTNNIPLLKYIARKKRPMIISTAMTTIKELENSVFTIQNEGLNDIAILQCTGNYPSDLSNSNLRVMKTYKKKFNVIVGYSDHTLDIINPIAATAMGAKVYEKHFTIDKNLPGPDHRMSLNPEELFNTIKSIRETELALGTSQKEVLESEKENRLKLRKSIVSNRDIKKNEIIKENMISIKRPGTGIPPSEIGVVIGKKTKINIPCGTIISYEMLNG